MRPSPVLARGNVLEGVWVALVDGQGYPLPGIRGRAGATGFTSSGHALGADLIEMAPGSAFPLHTHPGDHMLYIVSGTGLVHVGEIDYPFGRGDTILVPASLPHGVRIPVDAPSACQFLAVGMPHRALAARDRMQVLD